MEIFAFDPSNATGMPPKRKAPAIEPEQELRAPKQPGIENLRKRHGHEWARYKGYISISQSGAVLDHDEDLEALCTRADEDERSWYVLPANMRLYQPRLQEIKHGFASRANLERHVYRNTHISQPFTGCHITAVDCTFDRPLKDCLINATICTFASLKECDLQGDGNYIGVARSSNVVGFQNRVECLHESIKEGKRGSVGIALRSKFDPKETFVDTNFDKVLCIHE